MSFNFRNQSNEGISSNHPMPSSPENHRNSDSEMAALSDLEDDNEDDDDDVDAEVPRFLVPHIPVRLMRFSAFLKSNNVSLFGGVFCIGLLFPRFPRLRRKKPKQLLLSDDQEGDEDLPYPGFIPYAMKYLDQKTRPRNWCLALITNPWFERVSMLVILLNCVTLGMYQPCEEGNCDTTRCKILQVFDDFIFAFFTIEMTVKIIAMGMYGKGTYLADSWNRLDFFIVLAGALEYCLNVENKNLSAIRTIRVLRPLRAINRIPSMRILVMLLLDTLPMLGNVLLLCFFVFFIFGIVGVQLWEGILRQRCYLKQLPNISYPEEIQNRSFYSIRSHVTSSLSLHYIEQEKDYICSRPDDNGMHTCNNLPHYKIGEMVCNDSAVPNSLNTPTNTSCVNWNQYYTECKSQGSNPFQGTISFDNIGLAWVAIFLVISLEGWTDIMYYVQDAHSFWDWIYFVLLIVIGSFFMINLCLVVIATQFSETKKREMERMRLERARFHSTSTLASSTNNSEPTTCYAEIVKYIAHLWRRAKRRMLKKYRLYRYKRQHEQERKLIISQNLPEPIGIPPSRFVMPFRGGHDESGPPLHHNHFPRYHHHHHHHHFHHHHHVQNDYHSCPHVRHSCKYHNSRHKASSQGPVSGLSSTVSRPAEGNGEVGDPSAPHASPEISDIDLQSSPRRLVSGKPNSGSLLRVPSINNTWNENINEGSRSGSSLLSPSSINEQRRRSSVMFSDEVTTLNSASEAKNVCSSEKMTQTGDGEVWQPKTNEIQGPVASDLTIPDMSNETMTCQELLAFSGAISAALPTGQLALESLFTSLTKGVQEKNHSGQRWLEPDICSCCGEPPPGTCPVCPSGDWSIVMDVQKEGVLGKHTGRNRLKEFGIECRKCITCSICNIQRLIKALVEHKYFQQGILLAILFNTLSMGIEYHNQPEELTVIVEISNIVFSGIFAVEMLLKVIAEGPFGYISNGFNVFDGVIVILSIVELCQTFLDGSGNDRAGSSGLSVLRTFRLLRILKLVRFMPNLRRQLFVMLRTMDNVAVFFSLLILFIFIFSILGMNLFGCKFYDVTDDGHKHYDRKNFDSLLWALVTVFQVTANLNRILGMYLFGGKFCMLSDGSRECTCIEISLKDPDCVCDRKHFNNFLWATVTVFQILTQEDWNVVLFNGMEKTSHWAALYFVALMTFGNYVLFNLLVAILVEGFSSERNERREREARELEKQREKAAEIAAALFEEAIRASPTSDSSEGSFHHDKKNKWRSAEDIHQTKFNKTKINELKTKENIWKLSQNHEKDHIKCINVQKESNMFSEAPVGAPFLPLITHTAATPQDSPNTTADPNVRELNNKMSFHTPFNSSAPSIDSIDKSNSSQWSIPGLLKPPNNYKLAKNNLSYSSQSGLSKGEKATVGKDHRPTCPPRRVRSWRLSRPSLKKKSRRNSGTLELDDNQDQETILNNNHLNHSRSGSDHSRCNGNLLFSNTIWNDTQSHKCFSPQNSMTCKHSAKDVPQVGWSDSVLIQGSSKKENFDYPVTVNGLKANDKSLAQRETMQSKIMHISTASVSDNDISVTKVKQKEEFILNPENVESADNLDITTNPLAEVIPKVFYCIKKTGCFKEREDYSLYLFPFDNKFRQSCIWIVERKWFDNMVLLFIGLNCITLAMERPNIPPNSTERLFLQCANYIFTVVFALEMFVKVIATGMFYGENAYFTSGWNIMDGTLVTISIVDLLMSMISESSPRIFGILRVFRLLRSLRPLRVINRAPGLKLVVQTLLSSLRPIGNIVLICCTFFIIFGILGVQLFKGTFYYCEGPNIENVKNKSDCLADAKNQWINRKYNFDDLGKALMSLFVLSSRDGWVNIMYTGLDAVGVDLQPIKNYSEWRLLYFIAFILLVGFFVLNMFVGVVVENFHRCREEQEKEERMIRLAKRAKQMEKKRRKMHEPPYYTNYSKPRLVIHNVVTSKYFDLAIAAVIGLNVVTMAMEFYMMPRPLTYALKIFNYFFTAVFILELFMKLLALGVKLYLKDKWNQLDVAIVFLSIVGIVLEELESKIIPINPTIIRVMRVLRIARVLKLLKMAKGIRALLDTVMQALPQVGNLGLLFFLLFFIFAALGVELFGRLECSDEMPCQGLGEHAHFANFGMAFLTLFRVATGDNWNGIMKDTLRDNCDDNADCVKNCCVSTIIAPIFFVIFVLMAQFVLVNVVVAVLMKHLEESHKQMEDEIDMEVELERELQQEQEELEEELCLQALEVETQAENRLKRPLGKVLSLPANFVYHTEISSKDSLNFQSDDSKTRRGSSISFQSASQASRRQTFHSQRPLLPPFYPTAGFAAIFTMDRDKKAYDQSAPENMLDRQKLLRRMSNAEQKRKSSLSPGNSRRGSLFRPRTEVQTLLGLSESTGLMPCPSPQQLLSLTELVVDEKEREKRILRKALSMENRTVSEDISPESGSSGLFLLSPSYSPDKTHLKTFDDESFKKNERRPLFRQQQKNTEGMEKIEEGTASRKIISKKLLQERRRTIFKQASLDSKHLPFDKTREICPEEIAMVVQERRTPYIRQLRNKARDFSLDETPFAAPSEVKDSKLPFRRQLTSPAFDDYPAKDRKSDIFRQDKQQVNNAESSIRKENKDNVQLSMLENRNLFLRKSTQSSSDEVETAETSLTTHETTPSLPVEKDSDADSKEQTLPRGKQEKLMEVSAETSASTGSNSTTLTNLRSDSILSEDAEKDKSETKEETHNLKENTNEKPQCRKKAENASKEVPAVSNDRHDINEKSCAKKDGNH